MLAVDVDRESEPEVVESRRSRKIDDEMDITPMIDIVFLMLIFFLVAATPDQLTAVDLPVAHHGVGVSQIKATLFTVGEGGIDVAPVYAADGKIPGTELSDDLPTRESQIRDQVENGLREGHTDVVIKADRNVAYREVARVIKAVSKVEGVQIYLAVLEVDE